jgi:UDP-N-acetylglucosamine 2-epimerase (non-hydrolysing)
MIKKVLLVFGTRPEAIKMAPLVKELQKHPEEFRVKICVTAQHREMLDQVLKIFKIVPDYDLNLMKAGQDLYDITSRVLLGIRDVLSDWSPDLVLVHGDTTSSVASALAAFYERIPVAHVEAGLRTNNTYSPWPEEMNRQITSRIATFHFAPTETNRHNLLRENVDPNKIIVTGNTVIDALLEVAKTIQNDEVLNRNIIKEIESFGYPIKERLFSGKTKKELIIVTGHRRENFGLGFINICKALKQIAKIYPNIDILYPVHFNPSVQKPVYELLGNIENIFLIQPIDYLSFVYLMDKSKLILTDSGGIQEEAPSLGKPVLVMRDTTERSEAVEAGTVKLVGTDYESILDGVNCLLTDDEVYSEMVLSKNPYGDGQASKKIIAFLLGTDN